MWVKQSLLAVIGLSAGITVAGGLFAFIVGLGVISKFADHTHTGKMVMLYEDAIALGGILGNLFFIYQISIPMGEVLLPIFGIFAGIFVGCWSMAIADVIDIFPIFIRRTKITKGIPYIIASMGIGRGIGAIIYFFNRW